MIKSEIATSLEPLVHLFNELKISYYIGGSIASSAYGISRTTQDVDLISDISKEMVQVLVERLRDYYFVDGDMIEEAIESKSSFNLIHLVTMIKIDIFIPKNELFHISTDKRKIADKLDDSPDSIEVFLSSPEDVILSKLLWYQSGGEISERQWLDILGVIKVQKNNLEMEYLIQWSNELNIHNLLKKAFSECDIKI